MMLPALALATLMARCAPNVAPSTMSAIVKVESGGDPLAIGDNTTRRSYYSRDRATAERLARRLLDAGHLLDVGIAQIDSMNLAAFGMSVHSVFDPCVNLSVAARILTGDYTRAEQRFAKGQIALRHAIGMYNTGRLDAGARYVAHVLAAAGIREAYPNSQQMTVLREPIRSRILMSIRAVGRHSPITHRTITPWCSRILVTAAPASQVKIF
jgi:type IV secretion system protein VirB1